ncbi:MAG TPA: DUF1003 domain-containing protein [Bacteroidota bacterium]|nr:DUF1003 domain-containing protein [Bacteroidota bacterium]
MVDVEFFSKIPLFSSLGEETLTDIKSLWKPLRKETGQLIFKKGDPPQAMYLIRGGKVSISVWTEDNQEFQLSLLHDGDFFGELALIDGSPRTASAKAVEQVDLLEMTREDFLDFLRKNPDVAITMMGVIAQRLRDTNELIERRTTRNVNEEIQLYASFADRIADKLARITGSWIFIGTFILIMIGWVVLNTLALVFKPVDPYPYIFLNLILSCIAAIQAPIIMMSQNREVEKDRLHAELDYRVNLKSELQIQSLHTKLDELRASEIHELCELQREQITILKNQNEVLKKMIKGVT